MTSGQSPNEQTTKSSGGTEQLFQRMLGAAKFDLKTYQEVEEDTGANRQAALVVVIVAIASGIGTIGVAGILGIVWGILIGLLGWAIFAALTYWVGVNLLPKPETNANWGQLARTLAFARAPGVLLVFGIIPVLGAIVSLVVFVWTIATSVVAVREALDYGTETNDTLRALAVVIIAIIPTIIASALIGLLA